MTPADDATPGKVTFHGTGPPLGGPVADRGRPELPTQETRGPSAEPGQPTVAVRMTGISKRFGRVRALHEVDFEAARGEVHALLGQNGAGKTTLMNILCGSYRRDAGSIQVGGVEVDVRTPRDAITHGAGMVHQHPELVQASTGFENIVLGAERSAWSTNAGLHRRRISELAARYGLDVDLHHTVRDLALGQQQKIEILRILYLGVKVVVLDEATTHLTADETDALFRSARQLVSSGLTVIMTAHKMRDVLSVSDRITVLLQGRNAGSVLTAEADEQLLVGMVMGSTPVDRSDAASTVGAASQPVAKGSRGAGRPPSLRLASIRARGHQPIDVSFDVRPGEIVGIAGIADNGQELLIDVLAGLQPATHGSILLGERDVTRAPPWERIAHGLGIVPPDRLGDGILGAAPVFESLALGLHNVMSGRLWRPKYLRRWARSQIAEFGIVTSSEQAPTALMSGGNIQRLLVARGLAIASRSANGVLVAANPTQGLDVGATYFVHRQLGDFRERQLATLVISEDLDELMSLCDRILVLRQGRIVGEHPSSPFDRAKIGFDMLGPRDG